MYCILHRNIANLQGNGHDHRHSRRTHRTTGRVDHRRFRPRSRARPRRHSGWFLQTHQPAARQRYRPGTLDSFGQDGDQPESTGADSGIGSRKTARTRSGKRAVGRGHRPLRTSRAPSRRRDRRGLGGHRGTTLRHPAQRQDGAKPGRQNHHRHRARSRYAAPGRRHRGGHRPRLRRHPPRSNARGHHQPIGRTGRSNRPYSFRFQPRRERPPSRPSGRIPSRMRPTLARKLQTTGLYPLGARAERSAGARHHAIDRRAGPERRPVESTGDPCGLGCFHFGQ